MKVGTFFLPDPTRGRPAATAVLLSREHCGRSSSNCDAQLTQVHTSQRHTHRDFRSFTLFLFPPNPFAVVHRVSTLIANKIYHETLCRGATGAVAWKLVLQTGAAL